MSAVHTAVHTAAHGLFGDLDGVCMVLLSFASS